MSNVVSTLAGHTKNVYFEDEVQEFVDFVNEENETDYSVLDVTLSVESDDFLNGAEIGLRELENVVNFLENFDGMYRYEQAAVYVLLEEIGYDLEDTISKYEDVILTENSLEDAAEEFMNDVYTIPSELENYIDYEKFANDCVLGGDWSEFTYEGTDYVLLNANSI